MIEKELAWAAGFFDGEGHTQHKKTNYNSPNGKLRVLQVGQKYPECLYRLQEAVGGRGKIYKSGVRAIYYWYAGKQNEVDTVLNLLWPHLSSIKKKQAENAGFKFGVVNNAKVGRPKRPVDELKLTICHPTRKHVGNGLCGSCYQIKWRNNRNGK